MLNFKIAIAKCMGCERIHGLEIQEPIGTTTDAHHETLASLRLWHANKENKLEHVSATPIHAVLVPKHSFKMFV